MSDTRIIKKYPNRRLYDTGRSSYIRLDDVHQLVCSQTPIRVLDQRSGADITQAILMQTLALLEERQPQLLSTDSLLALIRQHGTPGAPEAADKIGKSLGVP
jgi:polyhydroxyalkanoate synthesis repressor PhaR